MRSDTVSVLAEDPTDVATFQVLIQRIVGTVKVHGHGFKGCARLKRKAEACIRDDHRKGVRRFVIVHDLDRNPNNDQLNDEVALRRLLSDIALPSDASRVLCIPIEELEAWWFSCAETLEAVARRPIPPSRNPHLVVRPKEDLMRLSRAGNRRPRYSTNDNPSLAKILDLEICGDRCRAFAELKTFLDES